MDIPRKWEDIICRDKWKAGEKEKREDIESRYCIASHHDTKECLYLEEKMNGYTRVRRLWTDMMTNTTSTKIRCSRPRTRIAVPREADIHDRDGSH